MPSAYLRPIDLPTYGVPSATAAQVTQASVLIDAYLNRSDGLLYTADKNGNPAYMSGLGPELQFTSVGGFGAGNGIQVQVNGPYGSPQVGDCVVVDRQKPDLVETVQILGINGNQFTLGTNGPGGPQGLQFVHSAGATLETGLVIDEQRYVPRNRSTVLLTAIPVARVIGGTGRYGYGRRGGGAAEQMNDFNLLAAVSQFGGPPLWEVWPANNSAGIDADTGQLWVPSGLMMAYYTEVKVRYVAGFQYQNLPAEIKLACAELITAIANNPQLGNFKTYKAGDTTITQFAATMLSSDVKSMLQQYRARGFA